MNSMEIDGLAAPTLDAETRGCMRVWAACLHSGLVEAAQAFKHHKEDEPIPKELRWLYARGDELVWQYNKAEGRHISVKTQDIPGSFTWLCDLMGFDPDQARAKALMNFRELVRKEDAKQKRLQAEERAALAKETPELIDGLPEGDEEDEFAPAFDPEFVCTGLLA